MEKESDRPRPNESVPAFKHDSVTPVNVTKKWHGRKKNTPFNKCENHNTTDLPSNVTHMNNLSIHKKTDSRTINVGAEQDNFSSETAQDESKSKSNADHFSTEESGRTNLTSCLHQKGHMETFVSTQHLYYHSDDGNNRTSMTCTVAASTSAGKRLVVEIFSCPIHWSSGHNGVRISDGESSEIVDLLSETTAFSYVKRFSSDRNRLTLEFTVSDPSAGYCTKTRLTATGSDLEVVRLSPTQGYIQTPGNDQWQPYLNHMHAWQRISPHCGHVTLLSMSRLHIEDGLDCYDVVEVYQGDVTRENRLWRICGTLPPNPTVLNARNITVHFSSDRYTTFAGFRLLFSFHPKQHEPVRLTDTLWNCSVPEWPVFQVHFLCDLGRQCEGWEDEAFCSYTGRCGPGLLTLDNRCYSYVAPERQITWEEASYTCVTEGGYLASLNTPQEWDAVTAVLKLRQTARNVFVGLKGANPTLPSWYINVWQWADGTTAFYMKCMFAISYRCGYFSVDSPDCMELYAKCARLSYSDFLCEFPSRETGDGEDASGRESQPTVRFTFPSTAQLPVPYVQCPTGHLTHDFLACDERSACWSSPRGYGGESTVWGVPSRASCPAPMTSLPAMFECSSGWQRVPYSVVCDHRQQCVDGSDERHCVFPSCSGSTPLQCPSSSQCVRLDAFCDGREHCMDRGDEKGCITSGIQRLHCLYLSPPAVVTASSFTNLACGVFRYNPIANQQATEKLSSPCPYTHFQCPDPLGFGYCLPLFLRCNEVADCPGREDEDSCDVLSCPGLYHCRNSLVCLHVSFVCDGVYHCSEQDDELNCHSAPCPHNCTCHGLAFTCNGTFMARSHPEIRYLNAKGSGMVVGDLSENAMLVHLSLASCRLRIVGDLVLPNLRSLDLSDNLFSTISIHHFREVANLQILILSGNSLTSLFSSDTKVNWVLDELQSVDVSWVTIEEINWSNFDAFPNVLSLNLSHSSIRTLNSGDKASCGNLRVLDLRHSHLTHFQLDVLSGLGDLDTVFADNYKLCCTVVLPTLFNSNNCHSPADGVSSCDNLLSSAANRVLLAVCCCFALLGNIVSIGVRVFVHKRSNSTPKDVFMTQLAVGDVAMGVCVAVVAVADRLYHGRYVLEDIAWRHSIACKSVGFLFLLSSQVCVSVVFLVAVDVLLSLFSPVRGLSCKSAHVLCVAVWLWCTALAAVPLLPTIVHWELLGQTAVCIPLLTGRTPFSAAANTTFTTAYLIINFLFVSLTAVSLIFIHFILKNATKTSSSNISSLRNVTQASLVNMSDTASHARCVFSSCVLNVVCWLSLCALAALGWRTSPLPDELHVHVDILALPVASALRPFLFALGVRGERRRRETTERLMAQVAALRRQRGQNNAKSSR